MDGNTFYADGCQDWKPAASDSIRDGFIAIMPVTMVGSIAVLLNVFLRDLPNEWLGEGNGFVAAMDPIIAINGNVYFGSITVLGIAFTISLGYHLSKSYDVNPIAGAVIAFSAVVTCMNQNAVFNYILNGVDLSSLDSLKAADWTSLKVKVRLHFRVSADGAIWAKPIRVPAVCLPA